MSNRDTSPEVQKGIDALFTKPAPIVTRLNEAVVVGDFEPIIPTMIKLQLGQSTLADTTFISYIGACDLHTRKVYSDGEFEEQLDSDNPIDTMISELNTYAHAFNGDPSSSRQSFATLAEVAYLATISRPRDLVIPDRERLHRSDLRGSASPLLRELTRHRVNFIRQRVKNGKLSKNEVNEINKLLKDAESPKESLANFVTNNDGSRQALNIVNAVSRYHVGQFAQQLLPLVTAPPDEAEGAKAEVLDRSYDIVEASSDMAEIAAHNEEFVPAQAMNHIIKGDRNGGGHVLSTLHPRYFEVVKSHGTTDGGVRRSNQEVPVASVSHKGSQPVTRAFFPLEWSLDDVKLAVTRPNRLLLSRVDRRDPTKLIQTFEHRGIVLQRILDIKPNGIKQVSTVHLMAPIPDTLKL